MKTFFYLTILCMVFGSCKNQTSLEASDQPNIVLFFVDDMGWQDTSLPFWHKKTPFNERYNTPNMEKLASEGMMFTQAYATPVCSPTRISLMTGMNAARHRVTNWTLHKDALQPMETNHKALSFPAWNVNGMSPEPLDLAVYADALPSMLQKAGYFTIHAGKAHFGAIDTPAENPEAIGFDVNIAGHAAGGPGSYLGANNFSANWRGGSAVWDIPGLEKYHGQEIFLTEALTREAIIAMDKAQGEDKPFFMYMSHYAVHAPIEKDERYYQKYLDKGLDEKEASYAALIEGMDKSLGDIMKYLKEKNLMNNTIILFMSDNGGLSVHSRGGEPHTHNKPLSSGKGSVHEGGIRVPMIVKWPGVTIPGSKNDNYLIIEDFYPSILEMAGVEDKTTVQKVDGKSFTGLLKNNRPGQVEQRSLFWHYPNEWGPKGPGIGAFSAIRKGDFKLIYYHIDESFELFNIREDIGEQNNLAATKPETVKALANLLKAHLKEVAAQMPIHKESGTPVAYPGE